MQISRMGKMIPNTPQSQLVSNSAPLYENSVIILVGVGDGALAPVPRTPQINLGLPLEEADLEFEQLQELEHELEGAEVKEDKERETLWGTRLPFLGQLTGKAAAAIDDRRIKKILASKDNLYDIPEAWRGSIYRFWEKQINKNILEKLKPLLEEYKRITDQGKITKVYNSSKMTLSCTKCQLTVHSGAIISSSFAI